jgi:hypothetical protein
MKRDTILFIEDILESIDRIKEFAKDFSEEDFCKNKMMQDAVVRNLEIIGEAVKNVPEEFRKKYPKIEWKDIAGLRDKLTHAYFGVDLERVWRVVKKDLPKLKKEIKFILKNEND